MEIIELLTWLAAGYVAVRLAVRLLVPLIVRQIVKRLESRLTAELQDIAQDHAEETLITLTVEVDGDQYLCYNSTTMTFVCQGRDIKEIRERFRERFPNKSAAIYDGNDGAIAVLRQQLKELNENSRSIGPAS